MKYVHPVTCALITMLGSMASSVSFGEVIGSAVNPATGHAYLLLGPTGWVEAEAEAVTLGGHLVTINDLPEQDFVWSNFGPDSPFQMGPLWIGLNDAAVEGTFVWSSGEPVTFTNWKPGEPNGFTADEDYVAMDTETQPPVGWPGRWNDYHYTSPGAFGAVVEIPSELARIDVRPGSCPNPLNRGSRGVLPVVLVGSGGFDAAGVDVGSLRLRRADGVGGEVAPNEGPPGPHTTVGDAATPFIGELCGCHHANGDGTDDQIMHFRVEALVAALQLDDLPAGTDVALEVTGMTSGGASFAASDCVRLVPAGSANLRVMHDDMGGFIDIVQPDETLDAGGFGEFERAYADGEVVTLTAPETSGGRRFSRWVIDGVAQPLGQRTVTVTATGLVDARPGYAMRTGSGTGTAKLIQAE